MNRKTPLMARTTTRMNTRMFAVVSPFISLVVSPVAVSSVVISCVAGVSVAISR